MSDKPGIVIDASGLFEKIAALRDGLKPTPYLVAIGLRLMSWVDQHFKNPIDPTWPRLSPNTIAARRGGGKGAKPLQDTGRLRMSWTRAGGNPEILGEHTVRVSSNVAYAGFHEFGTSPYTIKAKKPGGKLRFMTAGGPVYRTMVHHPGVPKRQMSPPVETARRLAVETLEAALEKLIRSKGQAK